jgi:protein O-mannosyl-transferase
LHIQGDIAIAQQKPDEALRYFNSALAENAATPLALAQAAELGSAGYPRHGLSHLQYYEDHHGEATVPAIGMPRIHDWVLRRQGYWGNELVHLRNNLRVDLTQTTEGTISSP